MNASLKFLVGLACSLLALGSLLALKPTLAAAPLVTNPILTIDNTTLTTNAKDAATGVQDARPAVANRGVNVDGSARARAPLGWAIAGNPFGAPVSEANISGLRLSTGTYTIEDVDLALPNSGTMPLVIGRTYNARQDDSGSHFDSTQSYQGVNWFQSAQPEILLYEHPTEDAQDVLYLVYGADRFLEFDRVGAASNFYRATNGASGMFHYNSTDDVWVYHDQVGNKVAFLGFGFGTASGQFWKQTSPDGSVSYVGDSSSASTASSSYDSGGRITEVYDPADRRYTFTYTSVGGANRLTKVEAETKTGGTWASPTGLATVGKVEYEYYVDADSYGDDGDLKLVTITTPLSDSGVNDVRKKYYRYYEGAYNASTNPGHVHALKYFIDFEGVRRYDWDQDASLDDDFLNASNTSLETYASAYFEYDSSHRVNEAWFNGECGCSGTGNGTHEFEYESNGSYTDNAGYDTAWMGRTVVKQPDNSYLTVYHDEAYQALSRVITDADPDNTSPVPDRWVTRVVRSSSGQVTDVHSPANCTGYTHSTGVITSSTSAGLVTSFERYGSSTEVEGFIKDRTWKEGTSGTAYMSESFDFDTASATIEASETLYRPHVTGTWRYDSEVTTSKSGSGAEQSERTQSYHSSTLARADEDFEAPVVSTANNGPGGATGDTRSQYRDTGGRVTFRADELDVVAYSEYTNGQLTKSIADADTTKNGAGEDFNGVTIPSGYSTTSGLHFKTTYAYDAQGRLDTSTANDGQVTKRCYSKLADGHLVTLTYADYEASPEKFYGPVQYSVTNHAGKVVVSGTIALSGNSSTSAITAHVDETDDDPITAIDVGSIAAMTTSHYSKTGGTLEETRMYFSIPTSEPGTDGTHYDPVQFGYDDSGRQWRTKEASGTIRRTVYDAIGRPASSWIGTNDSTFSGGESSGTDDMIKVSETVYDSDSDDGNSYVTKRTAFVEDSTTDQRVTEYTNDVRGRVLVEKRPVSPHAFHKYDNNGRRVATGLFSSTASISAGSDDPTTETTNRLALSETEYDEKGQVYKTIRHKIDVSDGSSDDTLESLTWYDATGRVIKTDGEQLAKTTYDALGRPTHRFVLANDNDSAYADADDVTGDIVLEEHQTTYESDSSEVIMEAAISRHYRDEGASETTGALDTNADSDSLTYTAANVEGRIQITAHWYDRFGRRTDTVRYGTNGGSDFDRDGLTVPARSDTALRTTFAYNDDGDLETTTDPRGLDSYRELDAAGRVTKEVRNYDSSVNSGNPSGTDDNVTVKYEYTDGLQTKLIADVPAGGTDQETVYTYGTTKSATAGDSEIGTGHLLQEVKYPDSSGASDVVSYAYNAQGELTYTKDQAGNVIETDLDDAGREEHRRITTLASGFDGAVRRISLAYTDLGQTETVTQYDNATVGSGSIVDEVKYSYDGWTNVSKFEQDLNSAVGAAGSVDDYEVAYSYEKATAGRNTLRRDSVTLPSGNLLDYLYLSTSGKHDDETSRVSGIEDGALRLVDYRYNGVGQVVTTLHQQPEIHWKLDPDGDDTFADLDRFNRVTSSRWTVDLATDVDFYSVDIAYDRGSNITLVEDNVHTGFDASYTMDDVDRLTRTQEGTWNGSSITSETRDQEWTLSHTGNWDVAKWDLNGDGDWGDADEYEDTRTHNAVNELEARDMDSDSTDDYTHAYDAVGNMTDDGESYKYEWDPFGRLRKVKNQSDALVAEYKYNGLGFQVSEHADTDDDGDVDSNDKWFHSAYDERWRKLATFREDDSDPKEEFVAHQAGLDGRGGSSYINLVVCRDKDANTVWTAASDGVLEEKMYYCQNWRGDVSAIVRSTGYLYEWAKYSSYGVPFGLPGGDTDSDGDCDATDVSQIQTWINASSYDVRGDIDLDGNVDADDKSVVQSFFQGKAAGWAELSTVRNRSGYSGYAWDGRSSWHSRNRELRPDLGTWLQRDPLGYIDGGNLLIYLAMHMAVDPMGTQILWADPGVSTEKMQQQYLVLDNFSAKANQVNQKLNSTNNAGGSEPTVTIHVMTPEEEATFESQANMDVTGATVPETDANGNATGNVDVYIKDGKPGTIRESLAHELQHAEDYADGKGQPTDQVKEKSGGDPRHKEIRENAKKWAQQAGQDKKWLSKRRATSKMFALLDYMNSGGYWGAVK